MECNRDDAQKAMEIAERKFMSKDVVGAKKFALKAQRLFPALEGISHMIAILDVHLSAVEVIKGEKNWYGILCVEASADDETVKKNYKKLARMLHPDKNKVFGAEAAFKHVSEAWSVLSDKARRINYDQKRNANQQAVSKSNASSNGSHHTSKPTANVRAQMNTARSVPPGVPPSVPPISGTFWTSCIHCKMQYEYLIVYLNHNLLCPNCKRPFLAVETGILPNGYTSNVHCSAPMQQQDASAYIYGHKKKSFSNMGSGVFRNYSSTAASRSSTQATNLVNNVYDNVTNKSVERREAATDYAGFQRKTKISKKNAHDVHTGNSSFDGETPGLSNMESSGNKRSASDAGLHDYTQNQSEDRASSVGHENKKPNSQTERSFSGARMPWKQISILNRDLSPNDIRNMLMQKGNVLVQNKLNEWNLAVASKLAEKEKVEQKLDEREIEKITLHGDAGNVADEINIVGETPVRKSSSENSSVRSDKIALQPMSIDVPDSDFHDFDKDRSENSFEPDQVWATYDDEDGMPRFYCLIQKVISLKPFKLCMSFLNSKTNSELGPLNWVGMGFTKICGVFRVGRFEISEHINIFSHKVRWVKGPRGVIKIFPRRGDVWALYKNWSPDWNEHTPNDMIYKYDMVEVLDDYNEQGLTVCPLVKVDGFKTVFHRHLDPKEAKRRIPREEMFRFSHQVPSYLLTGMESENAPKGCHELDPAASPFVFNEVITEAKEEGFGEPSEKQPVT